MTKEEIMKLIEENMHSDHSGDLYGHDRVAEDLAIQFMRLESEIERLRKANIDMGWQLNPDRMGGQFTREETERNWDGWR